MLDFTLEGTYFLLFGLLADRSNRVRVRPNNSVDTRAPPNDTMVRIACSDRHCPKLQHNIVRHTRTRTSR